MENVANEEMMNETIEERISINDIVDSFIAEKMKKYEETIDMLKQPEMMPAVVGKVTAIAGSVIAERCVQKTVGDLIDTGISLNTVIRKTPMTKFDILTYSIGKKAICVTAGLAAAKATYSSLDRMIGHVVSFYYIKKYGINIEQDKGEEENGNVSDATTE